MSPPAAEVPPAGAPLPSWANTDAKAAVVDFVARVTTEGGPDFVPVLDRVATFDNDGTLWVEQPVPVQGLFTIDRVKELASAHPEWKTEQPFEGILVGDPSAMIADGVAGLMKVFAATAANITTQEFDDQVRAWLRATKDDRFGRPHDELVYQPMIELLGYLRDHGFKTFIVSGGGADFIRPWARRAYGIPPDQIVGSRPKLTYEMRDDGPVLLREPELDLLDDGKGKPVGIQQSIGMRPLAAFGNSDGDYEMLEWTTTAPGPRLGLIVHHTDAVREWAYDRDATMGKLDRALDAAPSHGWVVVDMKRDWNVVFPFDRRGTP